MSAKKKLVINTVIYSISGLLLKCFGFFLLPLYTTYLTTEDYGIISISTTFIATISFVTSFSLFSAILRFYVELKDDAIKLKRFYGTISLFVLLTSLLFLLVSLVFRSFLVNYVFSGIDYYPIIFITVLSLIFYCQQTIYNNILQSQQRSLKYSIISIVFFLISVLLNILLIVVFKLGAMGSLMASMVCHILYTFYFWLDMLRDDRIQFCLDLDLLREALKYSIPIIPHNLSTQVALFISKVFIGEVSKLSGLGVYTVATQFGNIADTVQTYVGSAYGPWLYEVLHLKDDNYKQNIREIVRLLIGVIGLFFLTISIFSHDYIILFINKDYWAAWYYVPLIVSVFSIKTIYYFYIEILFYYKEASKKIFWATLTTSGLNIILSYWVIPILGINGSILADAVSTFVRVLIIVAISRRYEDIGLRMRDFLLNFVIIECFIFAGLFLSYWKYNDVFSVQNFLYKVGVVVAYILLIAVLNRNQMCTVRKYIKTKFAGKR